MSADENSPEDAVDSASAQDSDASKNESAESQPASAQFAASLSSPDHSDEGENRHGIDSDSSDPDELGQNVELIPKGTIIDEKYEITGVLGAGGFAVVYSATQLNIQRPVALKILNVDNKLTDKAIERFTREARAAAGLHHPNTVTVHDIGAADGRPYIAMEPVVGRDLKRELRKNGGMEPERAVNLFIDALDALALAHEAGIVHRDLKPSNLVLTDPNKRTEKLKIIDFGIARLHGDSKNSDLTGSSVIGTPSYMAPEYIKDHLVSPALDVYQMGLILVEMLSGAKVVNGENPYQCLMMHASGKLPIPEQLLASNLGGVITKSLRLNPQSRYANAAEFRDALLNVDLTQTGTFRFDHVPESPREESSSGGWSVSGMHRTTAGLPPSTGTHTGLTINIGAPGLAVGAILLVGLIALVAVAVGRAPERESAPPPAAAEPSWTQTILVTNPPNLMLRDAETGASLGKAPVQIGGREGTVRKIAAVLDSDASPAREIVLETSRAEQLLDFQEWVTERAAGTARGAAASQVARAAEAARTASPPEPEPTPKPTRKRPVRKKPVDPKPTEKPTFNVVDD